MRSISNRNSNWVFIKEDVGHNKAASTPGEQINIPHTWNGEDGQSGGNNYYRGTCWYVHNFKSDEITLDKHIYLEFKGVNASATVYINDRCLGSHDGGYSTFRFEITNYIEDHNTLVLAVDNSKNERVYPQTADFTFYGGIYRDVNIISVGEDYFDLEDYGSPGIYITPTVDGSQGIVKVESLVKGAGEIVYTLTDANDNIVASASGLKSTIKVENVTLWHGMENPYLYTLTAQIVKDDKVVDELKKKIGFRSYSVDPKEGFILNGKKYPLRGVCRHQDRPKIGNALTKKHHDEDLALILEVGANTIRLAHYQHDDYFYELCDQYGFVIWAEIPYISRHMKKGNQNARNQMVELIKQQYNHVSIVCWGISNEITMYPSGRDRLLFHREMQALCKELDPTRHTAIACYVTKMNANRLNRVGDLISYNLYWGWYVPFTRVAGWKMDLYHWMYPNEPIGLAEYGAEAMPNLHSEKPRRGDNTEEYQLIYHEKMIDIIEKRDYLWATHIWNMFDFAADARDQGGEPGMNHKGLVTFDRKTKKDSFYLYKAHWSTKPFIHLCGKRFVNRVGKRTTVKVYTNHSRVELFVNGRFIEGKQGYKRFQFEIGLSEEMEITVKAGGQIDEGVIRQVDKKDPSYRVAKTNTKNWQK